MYRENSYSEPIPPKQYFKGIIQFMTSLRKFHASKGYGYLVILFSCTLPLQVSLFISWLDGRFNDTITHGIGWSAAAFGICYILYVINVLIKRFNT